MTNPIPTPKAIRKQQIKLGIAIVSVIVLLMVLCLGLLSPKSSRTTTGSESGSTTANDKPSLNVIHHEPVDAATLWLQRAENNLQEQQKATQALSEKLQSWEEQQANQAAQVQAHDDAQSQQLEGLQQRLQQLEEQLQQQAKPALPPSPSSPVAAGFADDGTPLPLLPLPKSGHLPSTSGFPTAPSAIKQDTLALSPTATQDKHSVKALASSSTTNTDKSADSYVPAGSFAVAVLLSGLDASAGVTSQAQPRPVLLRITGKAVLPDQQHSDLSNCLVTGAGFGDISSERAYIRLERLSCHRHGQITDFPVFGYVAGPDGKAGIRGRPVWREGNLLQRSFMSGLFSGLGQSITNQSALTTANTTLPGGEILKQGVAGGTSTSLGKLADYHIQRAEQYQPIIQVSAGAKVDIVFHTGFYLDGRAETGTESALIATSAESAPPAFTLPSPVPPSPTSPESSEPTETQNDAL